MTVSWGTKSFGGWFGSQQIRRGAGSARGGLLRAAWRWIESRRIAQTRTGRLRVAESVSLGEKRFVAVVEVDGHQFLVGGGASDVSLLAVLEPQAPQKPQPPSPDAESAGSHLPEPPFEQVLERSFAREPSLHIDGSMA